MASPAKVIVVEPEKCACVAAALAHDNVVRISGDLDTAAEMLSCGEASAPAIAVLRRYKAQAVTVTEVDLERGPSFLKTFGGPDTTPSGAAGLVGLVRSIQEGAARFDLEADSCVLVIISEGRV